MNKILISVIMPTYNGEKYLQLTIDSILNQTYTNFEYIIINDCSTDNSLKIILKNKLKDKRIKLINNTKNLGISDASNKGLKIAKGKYIAMIDQDDISQNKRFEIQLNYLESNPTTYLIGTGNNNIDENNNFINKNKTIINSTKIYNDMLKGINRICHPSIMYLNTQEVFYRNKIYFAQDVDFYLQLMSKGKKLSNIKETLLNYRIHPIQTSMIRRNKQLLFAKKAIEFYYQRKKYKKDNYNKFDPKTIFNIDPTKSKDRDVISSEVFFNFQTHNYIELRKYAKKYFKIYGYFNKIVIYYILSYLPYKLIKLIHNFKRRYI